MRYTPLTREQLMQGIVNHKHKIVSRVKSFAISLMICCTLVLTGCQGTNQADNDTDQTESVQVTEEAALSDAAAALTESSLTDEVEEDETEVEEEADSDTSDGDVIEIKEKVFATMCDDIYVNTEDYLGKTIKIEGMADESYDETYDETIYSVYRTSPGCCGNDGWSGFEYVYDGEKPEVNDWIEVVGVLESYELDGQEYLRLRAESVTVMDERGAEFVQN